MPGRRARAWRRGAARRRPAAARRRRRAGPSQASRTTARRTGSSRSRRTRRPASACTPAARRPVSSRYFAAMVLRYSVSAGFTVVAAVHAARPPPARPAGCAAAPPRPAWPESWPRRSTITPPPPRPPRPNPPPMSANMPTRRASATLRSAYSIRLMAVFGVRPAVIRLSLSPKVRIAAMLRCLSTYSSSARVSASLTM